MSVIVLKRKFETIPASTDIMQLLFGQDTGDRDAAKDALQAFLKPVGDLLDLIYLANQMKATAERHVTLMKEQDGLIVEIGATKKAATDAKSAYENSYSEQTAKLDGIADKIAKLEKAKTALEDEQASRDRLNTAMVAEVAAAKKEMLAEVDKDVAKAKGKLISLNVSVEAAEVELAALVEKKRLFIASLG